MKNLNICLAQINTTVGDLKNNSLMIVKKSREALLNGADVVVFPELAITGYPPEDLLLKKSFIRDSMSELKKAAAKIKGITAVVGFAENKEGKVYNSAAVIYEGKVKSIYRKILLPNYGVFDEKRYFTKGNKTHIIRIKGKRIGITICEDIWQSDKKIDSMRGKIDILLNLSASPYHMGKSRERFSIFRKKAEKLNADIYYVNLTGGQDELVFDGHSMVIGKNGKLLAEAPQFKEHMLYYSEQRTANNGQRSVKLSKYEEVYEALVTGTRDYIIKNGFKKAVIALSGGIDSAIVAAIAADAIGPENIKLIFMPTKYSSSESLNDARKMSENLGIKLDIINIQKIFSLYKSELQGMFKGTKQDITEENLQARIRGNIVMAVSNKKNMIVLTTGNKSEMSVGYATLYGDMAGGFAVIKDVPKTLVYEISKARNEKAGFSLIPENILKKAPTAELRPNQKDTDSLPEYSVLDLMINDYVEKDRTYRDISGKYRKNDPAKIIRLIDIAEYKRRQAPPGVKITPKSFGRDRRMPITNKYR